MEPVPKRRWISSSANATPEWTLLPAGGAHDNQTIFSSYADAHRSETVMTSGEQNLELYPHNRRWWVLLLLFLAMTINILDRQVLSLVAPVLRDQFHLSNTQYGTIVFSFLLGMTLAQIPVGAMMDRYGVRLGFSLVFVWW